MPKLERSQWYDLCRDMNWKFKYVTEAEVFPEALSQSHGIPSAAWWNWDEPYKISYREYVRNQAKKDADVYSVRSAIARSRLFENLDPGWRAAIIAHYGAYDWGEAFTALNFTVKPVFDELFNIQLAELARAHQDALLGLMLDDFALDVQRSRDWAVSLVQYATAQCPANTDLFKQWIEQWKPLAYRGMEGLVELFGQAPCPLEPRVVSARVRAAHEAFLARCGLDTVPTAKAEVQKSRIDAIGDMVAWGAHFCLFYETKEDLLDGLISYCKSGLENKEYCLWVVTEPLTIEEARVALKRAVPDFDRYVSDSSVEILSTNDFFLQGGKFNRRQVAEAMVAKIAGVSARGYAGVRLTGDTSWVTKKDWLPFCELEDDINEVIGSQRLAVLCTYSLAACGANEILDAVRTHQFALVRRQGNWVVIETAALKRAKAEIKRLNEDLEQRAVERTSDLMQVSEALRETQAELTRVSRLTTTGELAASIAHEVNQPLTAVNNNANACLRLLVNRNLDPEVLRRALEEIVADGTRASAVIARVRAFIKKTPAEKSELDINEVIQEALALVRHELQKNRILVECQLTETLPLVWADRVQLHQVLLNLIVNGIEAMAAVDDRPRLLRLRSRMDESGDILVAVEDSGIGLGSEADRVFAPFFTTKADGIGLGLPISRSLIEGLGGRLWVEPNFPYGAVFSFMLSVAPGTLS